MTVFQSSSVLLQDIYVNSTSSSGSPARNTDGADTIYSDNIHFDRWIVVNGDDSISLKANSTNILITNSTFYNGLGVAIGSIGQYKDVYETIENVTVSKIVFYKTLHGGYVKTWTGEQVGYPPNGGGGGLGREYLSLVSMKDSGISSDDAIVARNITFEDFSFHSLRGPPFSITQCTTFSGTAGNCSSSACRCTDASHFLLPTPCLPKPTLYSPIERPQNVQHIRQHDQPNSQLPMQCCSPLFEHHHGKHQRQRCEWDGRCRV